MPASPASARRLVTSLAVTGLVLAACSGGRGDMQVIQSPSAAPIDVTGLATVPPLHPSIDDFPEASVTLTSPEGGTEIVMAVKVADTQARRAHGFMEVPSIPGGTGMLFTFESDREGGFYMFQTLVPLDIAYVGGDGRVEVVLRMEPCPPGTAAQDCPTYPPGTTYRSTLEVPAGWFEAAGVGPGWTLSYTLD